jgi:hypothetical protein
VKKKEKVSKLSFFFSCYFYLLHPITNGNAYSPRITATAGTCVGQNFIAYPLIKYMKTIYLKLLGLVKTNSPKFLTAVAISLYNKWPL